MKCKIYKLNENKSKSSSKYNNFRPFKGKILLANFNNLINRDSILSNRNSSYDKKNNGLFKRQTISPQNRNQLKENDKENNITNSYDNENENFLNTFANKGTQSSSHYNIFTTPSKIKLNDKKFNSIDRKFITKIIKIKEESKTDIKNKTKKKIFNNNYDSINKNLYSNMNNFEQQKNLNLPEKIKISYNPNQTTNTKLNKQKLNNKINPKLSNFPSFPPSRIGINFNTYNSQNAINNGNQQGLTTLSINNNKYSLNNNNTLIENERLTSEYKLLNRKNALSKNEDNELLLSYGNLSGKNKKQNTKMNFNQIFQNNELKFSDSIIGNVNSNTNESSFDNLIKQISNNYEIKKKDKINELGNNFNNNINLEELLKTRQTNRTNNNNTKDFLNNTQNLNNSQNNSNSLFFEQYNSLNNLLTNQINNLYSFQTNIISNNNNIPNFQLNNDLNQLTYNQTNYETNIGLNHLHLNYIDNSQDDYLNSSSYEQFLNNKIQREDNKNFKESALLRDFGVLSRPGNDESGLPKINQDAYIIKTKINKINDFNIFGVLDGHGPLGNLISEFVSEFIPNQIINDPEIKYESNEESIYNNLKSYDFQIIKQAFICADNGLKNLNYDISDSGTTCVLIIHIGNHLICANVGDSRAVVAFDEEDDPNLNFLRIIPLSIDFKPELPDEKSRILTYGGMVEQAKNNFGQKIGPYRVYASGKDFPGLAMSRSIGDSIAKKIGVISEPGITEYFIGKNTKFFILCSDGVWEFLSNDNVRDIGKQFYLNSNAKELCQELISRSLIEWKTNDLIIDDITAIAAFFSK